MPEPDQKQIESEGTQVWRPISWKFASTNQAQALANVEEFKCAKFKIVDWSSQNRSELNWLEISHLMEIMEGGTEFIQRHLNNSYTAEAGLAIKDEDEENPGNTQIIFRTKDGEEKYINLIKCQDAPAPDEDQDYSDPWSILNDPGSPTIRRASALEKVLDPPTNEIALKYLVGQLESSHLTDDWLEILVATAEAIHFPESLRGMLCISLLSVARNHRIRLDGRESIVLPSLRRGSTFLPQAQSDRLLPFLEPDGCVDTRAVALEAIARLYETSPPSVPPMAIADRVQTIATRLLHPDVFASGLGSVIARKAVVAMASIGDARLSEALGQINGLSRPWLNKRVQGDLDRLRESWRKRGVNQVHPAVRNLDSAIAFLRSGSLL